MGAGQSKPGGADNSGQSKHNSADSKTPLTRKDIGLRSSHTSTLDQRRWTISSSESAAQVQADETFHRVSSVAHSVAHLPHSTDEQIFVHAVDGHSNVSRPPPPPRIRRLSELIDPADLPIDANVRSPSGNLLAPEQFLAHPDRPLSIRERQAEIMGRVRAASRLGEVTTMGEQPRADEEVDEDTKCWLLRCGCFG